MKKALIILSIIIALASCQKEDNSPAKQIPLVDQISGFYTGTSSIEMDSVKHYSLNIPCSYKITVVDSTKVRLEETGHFGTINISCENVRKDQSLIKFDFSEQSNYFHGIYLGFTSGKCSGVYNPKSGELELITSRVAYLWNASYQTHEKLKKAHN